MRLTLHVRRKGGKGLRWLGFTGLAVGALTTCTQRRAPYCDLNGLENHRPRCVSTLTPHFSSSALDEKITKINPKFRLKESFSTPCPRFTKQGKTYTRTSPLDTRTTHSYYTYQLAGVINRQSVLFLFLFRRRRACPEKRLARRSAESSERRHTVHATARSCHISLRWILSPTFAPTSSKSGRCV